jgi:hypothetical protein
LASALGSYAYILVNHGVDVSKFPAIRVIAKNPQFTFVRTVLADK